MSFADIAYNVIDDAIKGVLEQLNMSNINLSQILVVRSMVISEFINICALHYYVHN